MKIINSISILLLVSGSSFGQNSDPYEIFGHTSKIKYEARFDEMLHINNADTTSHIKAIAFDRINNVALLIGKDGTIQQKIEVSPENIFKWLSVDPLAAKYPGSSPYNYVDNNPILRIDPDGRDWIVSTFKGKDGTSQIKLTYAAAVMNSSGKDINMQNFMASQIKEFENVFGQGNVHANLMIRQVKSSNDLKFHESLIDIQKGSNFAKKANGSIVGGDAAYGGKFIRLNADGLGKDGLLIDKKTAIHEIGHTGGLIHTFEPGEKAVFPNGKPVGTEMQQFYNITNDPHVETNFMNYSSKAAENQPWVGIQFFKNNVGKATQGQTQTIINNLYDGNLNYDNIPKKKP